MNTVLQFLLGAGIFGVLVTQIATSVRAWLARRRERNGLLRILYTEVGTHQSGIEMMAFLFGQAEQGNQKALNDIRNAIPSYFESVEHQTWQDTRLVLAQALSSKEFASLANYYQGLIGAKGLVASGFGSDETYKTVLFLVNRLYELSQEVEQIIHAYVPDIEKPRLTEEDLQRLGYKPSGRTDTT